jgi:hypothetical protein
MTDEDDIKRLAEGNQKAVEKDKEFTKDARPTDNTPDWLNLIVNEGGEAIKTGFEGAGNQEAPPPPKSTVNNGSDSEGRDR